MTGNVSEEICVCLSSDDRFAPYLGIALHSVLEAASANENLHFFVFDDAISHRNKTAIEALQSVRPFRLTWLTPNMNLFAGAPTSQSLSRAAYTRLLMGSLLPKSVTRVIYMDCDVFVSSPLSGLWKTDLHDCVAGGVTDIGVMRMAREGKHAWPWQDAYINSGVLLVDLARWRAERVEQALLTYLAHPRYPLQCHDQDIINFVLYGKIAVLDPCWNAQVFWARPEWDDYKDILLLRRALNHARILHFCCPNKPWHQGGGASEYRRIYRSFMRRTGREQYFIKAQSNWQAVKHMMRYWWRHPFCFVKPSFWRKIKLDGWAVFW